MVVSDRPIATVISLAGRTHSERRDRVRKASKLKPYCQHEFAVIDYQARAVECDKCGAPLDPLAVLNTVANDVAWVEHLEREKARLAKEVGELKTEVERLKAARSDLKRRIAAKGGE